MQIGNELLKASFIEDGAQLTSLFFKGKEILQSFNPLNGDGKTLFPLLPMGNRVLGNSYILDNEKINLPLTSPDHKEYLHGFGWCRKWEIQEFKYNLVKLSLQVKSDSGYDFTAQIIYEISDNQFIASLNIEHEGKQPRLYGLGFHPYFAWHKDYELYLDVKGSFKSHVGDYFLEPFSEDLPNGFISQKLFTPPQGFFNFCCGNFKKALIKRHDFTISLISSMPYLMLYSDGLSKFLCLEPQSHAVDAAHFDNYGGLVKLKTGEIFKAQMCISID